MRLLKTAGLAIMAVLALAMVAATTASAALPEALDNVAGNTFTATSGEGELKAGIFTIKCKKDKATGEVTGAKTLTSTVTFEECSIAGLAANSLGGSAATIVVAVTGLLCFIKEGSPLEVGVLFTLPSAGVHIEIPAFAELVLVTGTVIGRLTPINELKTGVYSVTLPSPAIAKCGGTTASLKASKNEGTAESATEVTKEEVTFAKDIEIDG
jgi:hypothetical protein